MFSLRGLYDSFKERADVIHSFNGNWPLSANLALFNGHLAVLL